MRNEKFEALAAMVADKLENGEASQVGDLEDLTEVELEHLWLKVDEIMRRSLP